MKASFWGIQQKFVTLLLASLLAVSVFIAVFFPMHLEQQMSNYLNQKALVLAQVTAYGTASGVVFDDTVAVKNALDGIRALPDVQFALVYSLNGTEMGAVKPENVMAHMRMVDSARRRSPTESTVNQAEDVTVVAVPIVQNNTQHGQIILALTRTFLLEDVQRSRMITLVLSAGIVLLGGLGTFWQTKRLVRPIQTLERAASHVATTGDLVIEDVPIEANDEVGRLTHVFNGMVTNLRLYVQQVQAQSQEMAALNDKLQENNLELAAANEEIQRQIEIQAEQSREIELANSELQEKNMALDRAMNDVREAQSQLVQSERMNAAGMLTAGVMHEINNPNAAILGAIHETRSIVQRIHDYFFGLLDESSKQTRRAQAFDVLCADAERTLSIANNGATRVKNIVANLQHFTKHQRDGVYELQLLQEIQSTAEMFRYQFKAVAVRTDIPPTVCIQGNAGELNQVFLNLLVNAAQAGATEIVVRAAQYPEGVTLEIEDNGQGMPEIVQRRIFEAFYSTKGEGNSGLGLSISRQILERHSALIGVQSESGQGTTFRLTFPKPTITTIA
jgi:signal transduction histidine kinase